MLGEFDVTPWSRIWNGGVMGRGSEGAERLPSTEARRGFGKSREGRPALSPVEGVTGSYRDIGDPVRVGG